MTTSLIQNLVWFSAHYVLFSEADCKSVTRVVVTIVLIIREWINVLLVIALSKCPPCAYTYTTYLFTIH